MMEILGEVRKGDGGILQLGSGARCGGMRVYSDRGACNDVIGKW